MIRLDKILKKIYDYDIDMIRLDKNMKKVMIII